MGYLIGVPFFPQVVGRQMAEQFFARLAPTLDVRKCSGKLSQPPFSQSQAMLPEQFLKRVVFLVVVVHVLPERLEFVADRFGFCKKGQFCKKRLEIGVVVNGARELVGVELVELQLRCQEVGTDQIPHRVPQMLQQVVIEQGKIIFEFLFSVVLNTGIAVGTDSTNVNRQIKHMAG